jgi:hypothetical protein
LPIGTQRGNRQALEQAERATIRAADLDAKKVGHADLMLAVSRTAMQRKMNNGASRDAALAHAKLAAANFEGELATNVPGRTAEAGRIIAQLEKQKIAHAEALRGLAQRLRELVTQLPA